MELQNLDGRKISLEQSVSRSHHSRPKLRATESNAGPTSQAAAFSQAGSGTVSPIGERALTKEQKVSAGVHLLTLCGTLFLCGWNDATTGPLLLRIQEVYHVGFVVVSLIFVFACLGFVVGAVANIYLTQKFGLGKTLVFGGLCEVIGFAIQSSAPPFPVFVMAYSLNGLGIALHTSQSAGYVATLKRNSETKMGILQAAYGIGATISPIVSTQFAKMPRWSFHFLVSMGMAILNVVSVFLVFRLKTQDECLVLEGEIVPERTAESEGNVFRQVLRTKAVHLMAVFILIYVGAEVTIGGWIVTFIIDERGGGPSSGYISSGFFGGLTVGRLALLWVNRKVGERRVLFIYIFISIALELVIWLVPSLIGDAFAISIVGALFGPMYPIAMNQASRILPRWILTSAIGWIAGSGQAGSAILPFMTGAIASKHGIKSLQPLVVSMMVVMMSFWALVPGEPRRPD